MRAALAVACLIAPAVAGCSGSPSTTAESNARMQELAAIAKRGNRTDVPKVVASLRSEDPLVRWNAQRTLLQLAGTTNGYDWAAPRDTRDRAISAWADWCRRNGLVATSEAPSHD